MKNVAIAFVFFLMGLTLICAFQVFNLLRFAVQAIVDPASLRIPPPHSQDRGSERVLVSRRSAGSFARRQSL